MKAKPRALLSTCIFLVACFSTGLAANGQPQEQPGPAAPTSAAAAAGERVLVEWRFDQPGQWLGWTPNSHVSEAAVDDGALRGKAAGLDPILLGPVFDVPASPNQFVEIDLRTTSAGYAQLFWTHTLAGKYGGFSEKRCEAFSCRDDGRVHTYRMFPFWHAVGKIIRFRFDPPNAGEFALSAIRIVERPAPQASAERQWTFGDDTAGWRAWDQVTTPAVNDATLQASSEGTKPILMSPPISVASTPPVVISS